MADMSVSLAERLTVAEVVYRALKRDVITLKYRPGASLTEQELATAYGSSRVPVREACRRLQQEGLLTAVPYKGYFVTRISLKEDSKGASREAARSISRPNDGPQENWGVSCAPSQSSRSSDRHRIANPG